MPIIIDHRGILGDIAGTLAHLEALTADIERFGDGEMPSRQELDTAPLLHPYAITTRMLPCLIGGNSGHPLLKKPILTTTEIWVLAPEHRWARTFSRLYRLGGPARDEGA